MKERFKQLPEAIQKQIIIRFAVAIFFVLLFVVIVCSGGDVYLYLPCLLFTGFFIVNAISLFINSMGGNYLSIKGECVQIEATTVRKRVKSFTIECECEDSKFLTVAVRHRIKKLAVGDTVIVYLSEKTPVYNKDVGYAINGYFALEIRKETVS